jgi:spoIIIJ-associated protein
VEWVETTAKTVEQAKELALDQLHVDEADAEFEILETPRPGLFGRMRGEARVRARVRPIQPRPKVERRDRRRGRRGRGDEDAQRAGEARPAVTEGDERTGDRQQKQAEGRPSRRRSRSRSGRPAVPAAPRDDDQDQQTTAPRAPGSEEPTVSETPDQDVTVEEQAAIVQDFVEGLVEAFGYDAAVDAERIDDETIEVSVTGDDLGLLVGPRGNTLQAIHDLSRSVVQRQATGTHHGRVRLDIAGYRERRRDALARFTSKLAQQAIDSGVAQVLEPMSAADRKVVHDTVNEIDGVHTVSEGEDARRHVVIVPDQD